MSTMWLWMLTACVVACAYGDTGGSSLRGALEALQRRQRGRMHGPFVTQPDYDALYEYLPPQGYAEPDYGAELEDDENSNPKYVIKLLKDDELPPEAYEYRIVNKKNFPADINSNANKESAFRERNHRYDNERLRELFSDKNEEHNKELQNRAENDVEYALLLGQLWSKYRNNKAHGNKLDYAPQGIVKLYKDKVVKKRYPNNWGPIAFKKKRSSDLEIERPISEGYEGQRKQATVNPNYNAYEVSDDDNDDVREEYAIAFQPLDDDNLSDISDDDFYSYVDKRFPVTKRSSGPYDFRPHKNIIKQEQSKRDTTKKFKSRAGTDSKIMKDLSQLFGESDVDIIKNPVKRSSDLEDVHSENSQEGKPPKLSMVNNNSSHERINNTRHGDESHEQIGHNIHHPGINSKETTHGHDHTLIEKPITIKKKSIDWSDYFGIDKRKKQSVSFVNDLSQDRLRKQYFDTFNKEVIYPLNSFRKNSKVKRNFIQTKPNEETKIQIDSARAVSLRNEEKRSTINDNESKLDNIDKKLRNMEGLIVDEALHYTNVGEELDSKEEQEMKEKLLSRLAAAYSLEKMRKALKEFKQSLQTQKTEHNFKTAPIPTDETKAKRVAIKKEKVDIDNNEIPTLNKGIDKSNDFEEEQGAGHYLNGKTEEQFSEGYMGGSGRHRTPVLSREGTGGACPVVTKIVQRCRNVDILAGDRGQLFLPMCSLHQICYLCGEAPLTTCDLLFLSEADTSCEGDMSCQRAARSALMVLRELHENQADELDGECEASPCLIATLELNDGWHRAFKR